MVTLVMKDLTEFTLLVTNPQVVFTPILFIIGKYLEPEMVYIRCKTNKHFTRLENSSYFQ